MKITVRVAVDTGDDTAEPVETQVLALSRDELTPDTLGLHLAEARELLAALQEALVNAQVTRALDQHRRLRPWGCVAESLSAGPGRRRGAGAMDSS